MQAVPENSTWWIFWMWRKGYSTIIVKYKRKGTAWAHWSRALSMFHLLLLLRCLLFTNSVCFKLSVSVRCTEVSRSYQQQCHGQQKSYHNTTFSQTRRNHSVFLQSLNLYLWGFTCNVYWWSPRYLEYFKIHFFQVHMFQGFTKVTLKVPINEHNLSHASVVYSYKN